MAFNRDRNSRPGGDRSRFRSRPSFGGSPRFAGGAGRPRFGDHGDRVPVEMHQAVCDNCGKECEVPFRPTSGKPIYCSNCFENQRRGSYSREGGGSPRSLRGTSFAGEAGRNFERSSFEKKNDDSASNKKFEELNAKLDAILKILTTPEIHVETTKKPKASRKKSPEKKDAPVLV